MINGSCYYCLMKTIISLLTGILFFTSWGCQFDNIGDLIKQEDEAVTVESFIVHEESNDICVYFPVSDTGQRTIVSPFDDGYYNDRLPQPEYTVMDNINDTEDEIVIDAITGLIWTKCSILSDSSMDTSDQCDGTHGVFLPEEADILCDELNHGGYDDWRLPAVSELFSIVTFDSTDPTVNIEAFPGTEGYYYWTSTDYYYLVQTRYFVLFKSDYWVEGKIWEGINILNWNLLDNRFHVRCVRGPEESQ